MCCNNAYVNKNHELIAPEHNAAHRVKLQDKRTALIRGGTGEDKENDYEKGENDDVNYREAPGRAVRMHITDRQGDNEQLVKHIRSTSSIASRSGIFDAARLR
jgi:hypothetical protein